MGTKGCRDPQTPSSNSWRAFEPSSQRGKQMKQLLYVTQSCGYRHEVLPYSQEVMQKIGKDSGAFEATCTDDVATADWANLDRFDAIAFCTTGELPLSDAEKERLIQFVKGGKAF